MVRRGIMRVRKNLKCTLYMYEIVGTNSIKVFLMHHFVSSKSIKTNVIIS